MYFEKELEEEINILPEDESDDADGLPDSVEEEEVEEGEELEGTE